MRKQHSNSSVKGYSRLGAGIAEQIPDDTKHERAQQGEQEQDDQHQADGPGEERDKAFTH